MSEQKVIFITGASSGLGRAAAEHLSSLGHIVYGTSRNPKRVSDVPFTMLAVDVTDERSINEAVRKIIDEQGRIDVLISNAGMGYGGAIEETTMAEARIQMETNFFGTARACSAVLPHMRKQGMGLIINISSIAGLIGLPYQAFYAASKHAVEGYTETLKLEVAPYGINVAMIEPGDTKTEFTANRKLTAGAEAGSVYSEQREISLAIMENDEQTGADPAGFARAVEKLINASNPTLRTVTGPAFQKVAVFMKRIAPNFTLWALKQYYKMP